MELLVGILILVCGILSLLLVLTYLNIHRANREIQTLLKANQTNQQIHCTLPNRELELLFSQMNQLLESQREATIFYENKERELRKQITNISHDLRTPLTSILGYIELMKDAEDEEREEYLRVIKKRSLVLQNLITGFYELSRLESGEMTLQKEKVYLHRELCELIAAFYTDFENRHFNVMVKLDEHLPPVIADRNAILRIYTNLLQNILKHGSRTVFIHSRLEGKEAVISFQNDAFDLVVTDSEQVFERFFTADRMRSGENTGLGLTIAKHLTEAMGGTIKAFLKDNIFTIETRFHIEGH